MKPSKVTFQTTDGQRIPGTLEDDGINQTQRIKYVDAVAAGWAPSQADPLDTDMAAAVALLEHVKAADPEALGDGDQRAAWRLHAELGNLREALNGGDVRHAARAGVAFGKALADLRVRLGATDRQKQVHARRRGKDGAVKAAETRVQSKEKGHAEYRRIYAELRKARPASVSDDQIFRDIEERHGDRVSGRYGCGKKKGTIRAAIKGEK